MMDDLTLIKVMAVAAFYCGVKANKVIHSDYTLTMNEELLILFHELVAMFILLGMFFTSRPYVIFHFVVTAFVFALWFALRGNCILTLIKRQTIPYTDEDYVRIYGNEADKKASFSSVVGLSLMVSLLKILRRN
jgi:hypothetical protein